MSDKKNNRDRWIHLRLTASEYNKIQKGFSNSTKRKISEYARSILLEKPITVYTRNQSFDSFVAEMILLRSELKAIGNNLNQAVKKLHSMEHSAEVKTWALLNESGRQNLLKKVDEINAKISTISNQWSPE